MEAQKQDQKNENEKIQVSFIQMFVSLHIICIENNLLCVKESIY